MNIETTSIAGHQEQQQGAVNAALDAIIERLDDLELELLPCASPAEVMDLVRTTWEARRAMSEVDALTREVTQREQNGPYTSDAA